MSLLISHLPRLESEGYAKSYMLLEFFLIGLEALTTFLKGSNSIETRNCHLLPWFSSQDVSF